MKERSEEGWGSSSPRLPPPAVASGTAHSPAQPVKPVSQDWKQAASNQPGSKATESEPSSPDLAPPPYPARVKEFGKYGGGGSG